MNSASIEVHLDGKPTPLRHHWKHCVGSGHATLALRADWQQQLARCRRELGFEHVRFHGLLSDDVGTLVSSQDTKTYSFHNADLIMDYLGEIGMAPLVELSFMPGALASGQQTVFHYHANVTPPKEPEQWEELIGRLVGHWHRRYGRDGLLHWLFEVWNEPNQKSFWSGERDDYFELYRRTALAIKAVSPELKVGGPATAKTEWLEEFGRYCDTRGAPCDFISTHYYPTDPMADAVSGAKAQLGASARSAMRDTARRARAQTHGRPLLLTEWSITSDSTDEMHDEPIAAAYAVKAALEMSSVVEGSSWWTFSDIFEEDHFPLKPFHGGFGLLSVHGIPKPSYRGFQLLGELGEQLLPTSGSHPSVDCWASQTENRVVLLLSNLVLPHPQEGQRQGRDGANLGNGHAGPVSIRLSLSPAPRVLSVRARRIDEQHANPRREWLEMGQPDYLDGRQLARLHAASALHDEEVAWTWNDGTLELRLEMPSNSVALITCILEQPPRRDIEHAEKTRGEPRNHKGATSAGGSETAILAELQRQSFSYFEHYTDRVSGLVRDSSRAESPMSIAATGLALACYPVAVERGIMARPEAARLSASALRTMLDLPHGPGQDGSGHHGFYYHFLDPRTWRRARDCELSTIDSALLAAGGLIAAAYFRSDEPVERSLRDSADELNRRMDWQWALAGGEAISHGWHPIRGWLPNRWEGYAEALLLYALALGSPTHPVPPGSYGAWTRTYDWRTAFGTSYLHAGPLFIHQLSHCFIDFRGIRDGPMRAHGLDYFENSRRATQVHQRYAIQNEQGFRGYGAQAWGITACEGPGPEALEVDGRKRKFLGYEARGVPDGPDDGTLAPWAVVASLPFAPEIVLPTIAHFDQLKLRDRVPHGFAATFNATYPGGEEHGWRSTWHVGLNQGPVVLMVENHLSGLPWSLMRACKPVVHGLRNADFMGGWLEKA